MAERETRFLSREDCDQIVHRIEEQFSPGGETSISIDSWQSGETRWARNYTSLASVRSDHKVNVFRKAAPGAMASIVTNQIDPISLAATGQTVERIAKASSPRFRDLLSPLVTERPTDLTGYHKPVVWSDRSANLHPRERSSIIDRLIAPAEEAGMLSAGFVSVLVEGTARKMPDEEMKYLTSTNAICSMTVRDPKGKSSGWAGSSSYDWDRLDVERLAQVALEKCIASRNPVAVEPGRYTVILEPQATHDLIRPLIEWLPQRFAAEKGYGPFAAGTPDRPHESLIGVKVLSEQLSISYDPHDPALAVPSYSPVKPVTWVDKGVLVALGYDRDFYSLAFKSEDDAKDGSGAYKIHPGSLTLQEMIATTARGFLVTRFTGVGVISRGTLLSTGLTRDGLWLIEEGKISKAVKNFRFTDSPLFAFNNVEQVGSELYSAFSPDMPALLPPIKVKDFSFTSLVDAI